uniref:FYVE-type domain-containing protein n=1 Tax=Angiostrongylus cantonensis TaxID=6313 RepID=A0A158P8W6_ANGCA
MGTFNHPDPLREEYLELQEKYAHLQQQCAVLQARIEPDGSPDTGCFAGQLKSVKLHFDFIFERYSQGTVLYLRVSGSFQICCLGTVLFRCVQLLKTRVDSENCVSLFGFADMEDIVELRDYCSAVVAAHWKGFKPEKFAQLSAVSLLRLLKKNSLHVLHSIIHLFRSVIPYISSVVNTVDEQGLSPLELSLVCGHMNMASHLLQKNADCSAVDESGYSILMHMIDKGDASACEFLATAGADLNFTHEKTGSTILHHIACAKVNQSAMALWIESWLKKINLDAVDVQGRYGLVLVFLFFISFFFCSGCDGDAVRVPRDSSNLVEEAPLHRAVSAQMNKVVAALVSSKTNLNVQDAQGRTACHICVQERNHDALSELLKANDVEFLSVRDKFGHTPFSQALFSKQHVLAKAMIKRQPHVALQTNGNGESLLHTSVKSNDLESVLFLLSTSSDATRATDGSGRNALHYAADVDNELILRNLLLVGCDVNVTAKDGSTALHAAVRGNRSHHTEILLENAANANQVDDRHENALSTAVRYGSLDYCIRRKYINVIYLIEINFSGQSALHLCAMLTAEKVQSPATPVEICELLLRREAQALPEKVFSAYVDLRDADGNTALMLAYMVGNGDVCRCLLRYGATMGARNSDGDTIFTYETPTRLLLFRLLDSLEKEPRWSDGDICDCGVRFSITVRKHHCRHCGRLVCAKCSEVTMPIAKFGEEKRVRVCSLCVEVLTKGVQ